MRVYKTLALLTALVLSTNSFADYFDSLAGAEDKKPVQTKPTTDNKYSRDYEEEIYDYEESRIPEGYEQFRERCEIEYKQAKQVYLSEKAIFEQTKGDRKNDILKGVLTTAAGVAAALIGHNKGSDTLKYMGIGVASVGTGYTAVKSFRYIKDGKLERPQAPSYCPGMWDSETIADPLRGTYCGQVDYYTSDNYGRAVSYKTYICGREELADYRFYMGGNLDCASCN